MKVELLAPDAAEWAETVARLRHDFYHLPSYVRVSAAVDGGEPRAAYAEDGAARLLLPLIIRPIGGRLVDAASPYGYPGPLISGSAAFVRSAWGAVRERLRAQGVVSLFVRLHPLLNADPLDEVGFIVAHGDTVSIDLTAPVEEMWRQTRSNHRLHINRALRAGHRTYFDERWEHLPTFRRLYRATMERVSAAAYYFFPDAYFDELREALGDRLRLAIVDIDGRIAAAGLFVETDNVVQYHLAGSDEAFARDCPVKLLFHFVRGWAKERGNRRMHLGGGVGGSHDALFQFKAGFSHARHPFRTLRVVLDEAVYADLVRRRDPLLDPARLDGFFPLYRTPAAMMAEP